MERCVNADAWCTNTLWMGDVLASESLLTPMPGRWVLYHKHGSMPAL